MLIGNWSVLQKTPMRFIAGSTVSVEGQVRSNFNKSGEARNRIYKDGRDAVLSTYARPTGYYPPYTWFIPQISGELSGNRADVFSISGSATGAMGVVISGSSTFTLDGTAIGGLIAGGVGNATITIDGNGVIVATIGAPGSAMFTIGAVADPGALGWLAGNGPITIDGSMISYGIGHMVGTTADLGLTVVGIVNALWGALAAAYNDPGTMGAKLNSASAAGDPWGANLPGTYVSGEAGYIIGKNLVEVSKLHGLDPAAPLVVDNDANTRTAGAGITQTVVTEGNVTTVTRT